MHSLESASSVAVFTEWLGLAVREILGEVGFRELMQRGADSGVFHLETR